MAKGCYEPLWELKAQQNLLTVIWLALVGLTGTWGETNVIRGYRFLNKSDKSDNLSLFIQMRKIPGKIGFIEIKEYILMIPSGSPPH